MCRFSLIVLLFFFSSCYRVQPYNLEPGFNNQLILQTPSQDPFPPLNQQEANTPWGREYLIGQSLAKEGDYYRAITSFKRALILQPKAEKTLYLQYYIFLSYYLGEQYARAIQMVEIGPLKELSEDFPAYEDLKLILIDAYQKTQNLEKAESLQNYLQDKNSQEKVKAYLQITHPTPSTFSKPLASYQEGIAHYKKKAYSPGKAQLFNALLPGSGYLYVEQYQSALTSFTLNTLFLLASHHFFKKGDVAAGLITSSFEVGWYFGGIYGAGLAAKERNERSYYKTLSPLMKNQRLYPLLMLEYHF